MITALIVDDEHKVQEVLRMKLEQYCPNVDVLASAFNIEEAYELIEKFIPQLVFLDVSMPGGTGFDLLAKYNNNPPFQVIFITGHDEFALQAFKVNAIDYLLKPLDTDDLVNAVNKIRIDSMYPLQTLTDTDDTKFDAAQELLNGNSISQNDRLVIPADNSSYEFVLIKDVCRCEGWQKYTKIFLLEGKMIVSSQSIGYFVEILESFNFFLSHRSHLVNVNHIKRYRTDGTIEMTNGDMVPLSRRRKQDFKRYIK